jgi:hypothetical protein
MEDSGGYLFGLAIVGLLGGIVLFGRGLVAYRRDRLISAVATSRLDSLAAGEVRVSGVVEALDHTLTSPLQSRPCVWYRARIESTDDSRRVLFDEERAVHFRVTDGHGQIRVIPNGARWEIGAAFDESTSISGDDPVGLDRRQGAGYGVATPGDVDAMSEADRQTAIDALLSFDLGAPAEDRGWGATPGILGTRLLKSSGKHYREARLELGDVVTILGQALPWSDVREQLHRDGASSNVERAIAGDIAEARAAGELAATPEEAWGNAAIPGFGIGRPTRHPELDPKVPLPPVESPEAHEQALERYRIPDESLVLTRGSGAELAIYPGTPQLATRQHDSTFLLGMVGAVMSVCCTLALGAILSGSL